MMFNDVILRAAFQQSLAVIDLRLICSEPSDYANPIEPSGSGGAKIARAIAAALGWTAGEAAASRDSPASVFLAYWGLIRAAVRGY
jgi:hypothetical protein